MIACYGLGLSDATCGNEIALVKMHSGGCCPVLNDVTSALIAWPALAGMTTVAARRPR